MLSPNENKIGGKDFYSHNLVLQGDNSKLLVSSVKGTIHLYYTNIDENEDNRNTKFENYGTGYLKNYLPEMIVPSYFNSEWSFCKIYLSGIVTYSVFNKLNNRIYSFGNNGEFYEISYEDVNNPSENTPIESEQDNLEVSSGDEKKQDL